MKFLTKINRNFLFIFTIVIVVLSFIGYFILSEIIKNDTKDLLIQKEQLIEKEIKITGVLPNIYPIIEVKNINNLYIKKPYFKEVLIKNDTEDEMEPYVEYISQVEINHSFYAINIRQSFIEREDLITFIATLLFLMLLLGFGASFYITNKFNKTVWADFEQLLNALENFSFTENNQLKIKQSDISEFERLNNVTKNLTERLKTDYLNLKDFTENASHEIQTPIAIVLLNLEELLQQDLSETLFKKVITSINALKRLSALNKSLILLSKIENRQFETQDVLNLNDVIIQKIQEFKTVFELKKIKVSLNVEGDFLLKMNKYLTEILISNLLSNAVNHNIENGNIQIDIQNNKLLICNSGNSNSLTNDTIFNRFTKGNSQSYGLGLALVKNICNTHHLEINYYKNEWHCFSMQPKI